MISGLSISNSPIAGNIYIVPYSPVDPFPSDGGILRYTNNIELSVYVNHPKKINMSISFFNNSTGELIGIDENVESNTRSSIEWTNLQEDTTYTWYAVANDGETDYDIQSSVFSFYVKNKAYDTLRIYNNNITNLLETDFIEIFYFIINQNNQ